MSQISESRRRALTAPVLLAFAVAFVPTVGMATLQHALAVFAPLLMRAARMPPEAFGWVGGAMGLGAVWLYMGNTAFTVALGPVRALRIAAVVGITGAALVLSGEFALILLGAMLIGFSYATTTPAGSQILADQTPRENRGTFFSLRQAGVPLGGVVAGTGAGWLVSGLGWRAALAIVVAVAATLCVMLLVAPRSFNESRPLRQFRLSRLFAVANLLQPFRTVAATPGMARISGACVGFAVVQGATNAFFVTYMTAGLGLSLALAGALFATMQIASVAGRVVLGFVADWAGSPRPVLRTLAVLSSLSSLLIASLSGEWNTLQLFSATVFAGLSIATWNGLYLAEVASMAPDAVSEATAATTFFVFATYMVTPPLAGIVIATLGYRAVFVLAAIAALTSAAVLSPRRHERRGH